MAVVLLDCEEKDDDDNRIASLPSSATEWMDRISIMKATKRSILLEICVCILAAAGISLNIIYDYNLALIMPVTISYILMILIYLYFEIHLAAFKSLFLSFRGFVIIFALITIIICDWIRCIVKRDESIIIYNLIIDDIAWSVTILLLMGGDCIPKITNYLRLFGPILIIANCVLNILHYTTYPDVILLKHDNGEITINQIEIAATMQIILFGSTYIVSVLKDPKHKYFVILNKIIKKKLLLPTKDYAREQTKICGHDIKTKYIFASFTLFGIVLVIVFVVRTLYASVMHKIVYTMYVIDILFTVLLIIILVIMVYNHFEVSILRRLISKFRCIMLLSSIFISLYLAIQEVIWGDPLITIIHSLAFCSGIFVMVIRDGMLLSYPLYFSALICVGMTMISIYNLWNLTFDITINKYPSWYIIIKREPFYQVTVLSVLILYHMIRDCNETKYEKYFLLIRGKKHCKELFLPKDELNEYSDNYRNKMSINSDELVEMI